MVGAVRYTLEPELKVSSIDDIILIKSLIVDLESKFNKQHKAKGLTPRPLEDKIEHILKNFLTVIIEDQYILIVDRIESWFAEDVILQEQLLYRYALGSATIYDVVTVLGDLKEKMGCDAIQVGTLACKTETEHFALMKLYKKAGFEIQQLSLWR